MPDKQTSNQPTEQQNNLSRSRFTVHHVYRTRNNVTVHPLFCIPNNVYNIACTVFWVSWNEYWFLLFFVLLYLDPRFRVAFPAVQRDTHAASGPFLMRQNYLWLTRAALVDSFPMDQWWMRISGFSSAPPPRDRQVNWTMIDYTMWKMKDRPTNCRYAGTNAAPISRVAFRSTNKKRRETMSTGQRKKMGK